MKNSKPLKGKIIESSVVHYNDQHDYIRVCIRQTALNTYFDAEFVIWDRNDTELNIGDTIVFYSNGLFINWYKKEREV